MPPVTAADTRRIAMWSGPRNISTAMMRAWENRADCTVADEPFYAHYLRVTGADHPGRDEIIAGQDTDWRRVAAGLTGPAPGGRPIFYQKHMAHHLLPGMEGAWLEALTHAFLIRDPAETVVSYARSREPASAADLGMHRQAEIWRLVRDRDAAEPPVIDSRDVLRDPEGMLRALCEALAVSFDPAMLSWPAGPRDSDGVWGQHWYASVERSTGFRPYDHREVELTAQQQGIADACREPYEFLRRRRLKTNA